MPDYGLGYPVMKPVVGQCPAISLIPIAPQGIFIDRENDLLVVATSGNYNLWDIDNNASAILEKIYGSFIPD
jgi:hypothetical protein